MNKLRLIKQTLLSIFGKTEVKSEKKKILWIDMDDTICDFMTPFKAHVANQFIEFKERRDKYLSEYNVEFGDESFPKEKWDLIESKKNWDVYKDTFKKELPVISSLISKIEDFFDNGVRLNLDDIEKAYFIYPQSEKGFLLNLEPIPGAKENISKLKELFDIKILTKPSYLNPHCYSEKRIWIEEHYGLEMCEHLWFSPDKALVRGDYLVDDYLWSGFQGKQIQFGTKEYPNWDVVFEKLVNNLV